MNSVATLGAGLTTFRYSKDKEREADQIGLFLMADAGYDPQAGSLVWARLAAHQPAESNDFLSTHPLNEERYQNAIRLMPLAQERYRKALRKPPTKSSRMAADKTDPTLEFQSNQAFAAIQQGDFTSAEITLQNMLSRSPNYKGAHNMFGIMQLKKGDPTSALKAFNRGLKIAPHDATLIYNIACSHALKGDREAALTHLERAFSRDPQLVETAEDDSDLESLHDDPRFDQLLNRQFTVSAPMQVGGNTFSIN
jgi:predicted Zn-dependent protease